MIFLAVFLGWRIYYPMDELMLSFSLKGGIRYGFCSFFVGIGLVISSLLLRWRVELSGKAGSGGGML